MKIGIIGCGTISTIYLNNLRHFPHLNLVACADLDPQRAEDKAKAHGIRPLTPEALLKSDVELIVNLTIPRAHATVNRQILEAGKHLYCEKPLGLTTEECLETLSLAKRQNLQIGCAPDTLLGAGIQTTWKLLRDGWIGRPLSASLNFSAPGVEHWHPNPGFYYQAGGGPLFDMGPYYISTAVLLLGQISSVTGIAKKGIEERVASTEALYGMKIPVEANTHYAGILETQSGIPISATFSFETPASEIPKIEIHGTDGSISVPDPNFFDGPVCVHAKSCADLGWHKIPLIYPYRENSRGLGVAEMAHALANGTTPRCSGAFACHIVEIMESWERASQTSLKQTISASFESPQPMPAHAIKNLFPDY